METNANHPGVNEYLGLNLEELPSAVAIGHWVARLTLMRMALAQVPSLTNEGWGSGGQNSWVLAKEKPNPADWPSDPSFAAETMYALERMIPGFQRGKDRLTNISRYLAPPETILPPAVDKRSRRQVESDNGNERAASVRRLAARMALTRVGMLVGEPDSPKLVPAAAAALAYSRADISQPLDRALWDRAAEIDESTAGVVPKPRQTSLRFVEPPEDYEVTVYAYTAHISEAKLAALGFATREDMWWHELQTDLAKIDALD